MKLLKLVECNIRKDPLFKPVEYKEFGVYKYKKAPADNPLVHLTLILSKQCTFTWSYTLNEWGELTRKMRLGPLFIGIGEWKEHDLEYYCYTYNDHYFVSEINLSLDDIPTLINRDQQLKKDKLQKELERIKAVEESEGWSRLPIPDNVQVLVWNRDKGMCVKCGSKELLEFDHIIPVSKGGSNTARNIQLLCQKCNRTKHDIVGG